MASAYLGVDPGAKGELCLFVPEEDHISFIATAETPESIMLFLSSARRDYDVRICCIEDVHSIFGVSAKSNFNFGYNTGWITGIIQSAGIPLDKVTSKVWQKAFGVKAKGKAIKKEVSEICERLYPHVTLRGPRGGYMHDKSDALGIATYAYHKYK